MAKQLSIEYAEKKYILEYTRASVRAAENRGLDLSQITAKPGTNVPILISAAFQANHKWLTQDQIDDIVDSIPDREGFIGKLLEMYAEVINELFGVQEGSDKGKKGKWEANF